MIARGIREFVARDWSAVRAAKDAYWADRIERLGAWEGIRVAEQLRQQALLQNPEWPSADDRRRDLDAHVRLAERLRCAYPTGRD